MADGTVTKKPFWKIGIYVQSNNSSKGKEVVSNIWSSRTSIMRFNKFLFYGGSSEIKDSNTCAPKSRSYWKCSKYVAATKPYKNKLVTLNAASFYVSISPRLPV